MRGRADAMAEGRSEKRRYVMEPAFGPGRPEAASHTPHCRRLGIEVLWMGPCEAKLRLPYRPEIVGDPIRGVVFGGAITTLIDHASGTAVFCTLEEMRTIATLDLRIDYLRAAEPGRDLIGHARCYKLTRNVAFVRATAYEADPDDPFASCLATFMVGAPASDSPLARWLAEGRGS